MGVLASRNCSVVKSADSPPLYTHWVGSIVFERMCPLWKIIHLIDGAWKKGTSLPIQHGEEDE